MFFVSDTRDMRDSDKSLKRPFKPQGEMDVGDAESVRVAGQERGLESARSLDDVLESFRRFAGSEAEKGALFERLIKRFFEVDPIYSQQFNRIWLWYEWPGRNGAGDGGVDLVAERADGGLCAIQCKFYDDKNGVPYPAVTNFISEAQRIEADQRIFVCTTDKIAKRGLDTFKSSATFTTLLDIHALKERDIEWPDISSPQDLSISTPRHSVRPDQREAIDAVISGFGDHDRGKLILPCGVGKTFTSLKIAEEHVGVGGSVLFLVPSIALLGQTMRSWAEQGTIPHRYIGVCSDTKAGRSSEDASVSELEIPVTTDADKIAAALRNRSAEKLNVVFSTYQSIGRISEAQELVRDDDGEGHDAAHRHSGLDAESRGGAEFDLIICDEAHRTTGVESSASGNGGSYFTAVHDNERLRAKKRLYMTATPRIYSDSAKTKARDIGEVALYSMDDESQYGPEFHRMTFADAVENGHLSDYKVIVLNVEESFVDGALQRSIAAGGDAELNLDDAAKILGCSKALIAPEGPDADKDVRPLQRAIAFSTTIKNSKRVTDSWEKIVNDGRDDVLTEEERSRMHAFDVDHVDGGMNALIRNRKLHWLRQSEEEAPNACRILSNARCLTEGVDVPALDAVLFLQPRRSMVDVVQAVGRVMRTAPGKKTGYVILPIVIPAGVRPEDALDDIDRYRVVWEVLHALRSHDERLDAEINKIDLNKQQSDSHIDFIGVGGGGGESDWDRITEDLPVPQQYRLPGLVIDAFRAKVVERVGDREYWDRWAKDVADIAVALEVRIRGLIPDLGDSNGADGDHARIRLHFDSLLESMRATTNDSLSESDAVSIVAQHMITEPVFQALFADHDFAKSNPVARSLNEFVSILRGHGLESELGGLERFYASVRRRAEGLDNSEARRKVLEELYEKFFKNALPKEAQRLGVVYTPHELVDFVLRSADYLLRKEFGKSLSDEGVHILDPFAGMGTFIWRLLANSDLIRDEDLERKFWEELHANEILPLAYYMASINVEESFRERMESRDGEDPGYLAFEGMVYRDTFNALTRAAGSQAAMQFMQDNDKRAKKQDDTDIRVIMGNPPYSAWQRNENDANPNIFYTDIRSRISETYIAKAATKGNKNSLYDHYKMGIRWATDRFNDAGGIIGFVTSASFVDANADSGLRACLAEEFTSIYCFNLRGNQRTQGETSRREGGKIFGSGSRTPIAITLFVKNPNAEHEGCRIFYKDIGDYLTREQKLWIVDSAGSVEGVDDWQNIEPDKRQDWINLNDSSYENHQPIGDDDTKSGKANNAIMRFYSNGLKTHRDDWVYEYSGPELGKRMERMIAEYSNVLNALEMSLDSSIDELTTPQPNKIKWDSSLRTSLNRGHESNFDLQRIQISSYRPFVKQWLYFDPIFISVIYRMPDFFPIDGVHITRRATGVDDTGTDVLSESRHTHTHTRDQSQELARTREPRDMHSGSRREQAVLDSHGRGSPRGSAPQQRSSLPETLVRGDQRRWVSNADSATLPSVSPELEPTSRSQHSSPTSSQTSSLSPKVKSSRDIHMKRSGTVDEQCGRENLAICVPGIGGSKPFSALVTEYIPNLHFLEAGQNFPRFHYEEVGIGE